MSTLAALREHSGQAVDCFAPPYALNLVPIDITFEKVDDNEELSDNKKPVEWDQAGVPTKWEWMPGRGQSEGSVRASRRGQSVHWFRTPLLTHAR